MSETILEFRDLRRQWLDATKIAGALLDDDPRRPDAEKEIERVEALLSPLTKLLIERPVRTLQDLAEIAEVAHFGCAAPREPVSAMPELTTGDVFARPAAHLIRAVLELAERGAHGTTD